MKEHIQAIRAACIKANPEIVELKFGCEIELYDVKQKVISYKRNNWRLTTDKSDCKMDASELKEKVTILGRPIRLADVLLAIPRSIRERMEINHSAFGIYSQGHEFWNLLKDDLSLQTPETLSFIADLLK